MALNDGSLDFVVAKIEAYMGEFLQTRSQLLEAKSKIESALSQAGSSGSAQIGAKTFTRAELTALLSDNTALLTRNSDLQNQLMTFKDQVASVGAAIDTTAENISDLPWSVGGVGSMDQGAVVPVAYLIGAGALLATSVYLFISNVKSHLGQVAGDVGSNLFVYGGIALLAAWWAKKKGWI